MEDYLLDLLNRALTTNDQSMASSFERTAFKALREAETLANPAFIPQLMVFADKEPDPEKRDRAYFFLAHVAQNTQDPITLDYLVRKIKEENNTVILRTLLDRLKYFDKPRGTDLSGIIDKTRSLDFIIRHSAIGALKNTHDEAAEKAILALIDNPVSLTDLIYCNSTLAAIGTAQSLPQLLRLLSNPCQETADTALYALSQIADKPYLPLFVEQLVKGAHKTTALIGVVRLGDKSVIPAVTHRIHQLAQRKRTIQVNIALNQTEIIHAMQFLSTFTHQSDTPKAIYNYLLKKKEHLWPVETLWLTMNKDLFK